MNGVIGSISRWITRCMSSSRIIKWWHSYPHRSAGGTPRPRCSPPHWPPGRAAAGVFRTEFHRIFSVRQIIDEHGYVGLLNAAPVSARIFMAVSSVITYSRPSPAIWSYTPSSSALSRVDFPWYPPAPRSGDPHADAHAGDLSPVGQVQLDFQFIGRPERHAAFHGACGNARLPGRMLPSRHKRAQTELRQHFPDVMLILRQVDDGAQTLRVHIFIEQRVFHAFGYEVKEDLLQLRALMVRPLAGNPISMRSTTSPPAGSIRQAVRSSTSCPQRLTEMSPLFPDPFALNANCSARLPNCLVSSSCRAMRW